tara:strand:+ start:133 stop:819 length:687 start_codon:yes stop_codon:yes gene_type:complete
MPENQIEGIKACVFDICGTLFALHSSAAQFRDDLGDKADQISNSWRKKKLQYSWFQSLMQKFVPLWQVTDKALDFAHVKSESYDPALRQKLMNLYLQLKCYPGVPGALKMLKRTGKHTGILSNGYRQILDSALKNSSLGDVLNVSLPNDYESVSMIDPRGYKVTTDRFNYTPPEICFMSSNSRDAWAASHFGLQVAWVNFFDQPPEYAPSGLAAEITTLEELPPLLDL